MTPARWQCIKSILAEALEQRDATGRRASVERACGADEGLRREVESLLAREATGLDQFAERVGEIHGDTGHGATDVGRRLGTYELTRELGRGGMGAVYLARRADGRFEQQVAVKLLKRGTDTDEVLRRFRAERRILARLEHPNMARLLRPEEGGEPGLTITLAESRRLTPAYVSPEQVRGLALTTASDVYSLGALLYELLTGVQPHRFSSPHPPPTELLRVIGEEEPLRPSLAADAGMRPRLRGDLDNIVSLAMRKDPTRRYPGVGALADDLRCYLESRPVRARTDTVRYRVAKFVNRNKTGVTVGAVVLLALTTAGVVALWEARQAAQHAKRAERRFNDVRALAHSFSSSFTTASVTCPARPRPGNSSSAARCNIWIVSTTRPGTTAGCSSNWPPRFYKSATCRASLTRRTWATRKARCARTPGRWKS